MNEFDEVKKEILDSTLAGQSNWTEDTKVAFSIERIKKLKKKLLEFEKLVEQMNDKLERKVKKLSENWRIDDTEKEIEKLEAAVKIAFEAPFSDEEKSSIMKNPFGGEIK